MATLTVATVIRAGIVLTTATCSATGDKFANNGKTWVELANTSAASRTVTFATAQTVLGLAVADLAVTISGNSNRLCGPFPTAAFNSASGYCYITYSAVTNLKIQAIKLGT